LRSSGEQAREGLSSKLLIGCGTAFPPRVTPFRTEQPVAIPWHTASAAPTGLLSIRRWFPEVSLKKSRADPLPVDRAMGPRALWVYGQSRTGRGRRLSGAGSRRRIGLGRCGCELSET